VAFISYQENIDFSTPAGKMMFHIIGAMAEFERELIRERVRAGIQNAQKKGIKVGRRALSEIAQDDVMELRSKGHSIRNIAKKLHLSVGSVHKTLSKAASWNGLNT
jgi:DNA invertase Pin-like site-specific DNA recombinase